MQDPTAVFELPDKETCNVCLTPCDKICEYCYKTFCCDENLLLFDDYRQRDYAEYRDFYVKSDIGKDIQMPALEKLQINEKSQEEKENDTKKEVNVPASKESQRKKDETSKNKGDSEMPAIEKLQINESKVEQGKSLEDIKSEMPASNTLVVLTSFSSTNLVFIRSKAPDADLAYFEIAPKLRAMAKEFVKLKVPPKVGTIVVVLHEGQFERAQILKLEPIIKVILLESGTCCEVKLDDLHAAPDAILNLRRLPVPVKLKDVPLEKTNDIIRNFMTANLELVQFVVKYDAKKDLDANTGVYEVHLFDLATSEFFNETISKMISEKQRSEILLKLKLMHGS